MGLTPRHKRSMSSSSSISIGMPSVYPSVRSSPGGGSGSNIRQSSGRRLNSVLCDNFEEMLQEELQDFDDILFSMSSSSSSSSSSMIDSSAVAVEATASANERNQNNENGKYDD